MRKTYRSIDPARLTLFRAAWTKTMKNGTNIAQHFFVNLGGSRLPPGACLITAKELGIDATDLQQLTAFGCNSEIGLWRRVLPGNLNGPFVWMCHRKDWDPEYEDNTKEPPSHTAWTKLCKWMVGGRFGSRILYSIGDEHLQRMGFESVHAVLDALPTFAGVNAASDGRSYQWAAAFLSQTFAPLLLRYKTWLLQLRQVLANTDLFATSHIDVLAREERLPALPKIDDPDLPPDLSPQKLALRVLYLSADTNSAFLGYGEAKSFRWKIEPTVAKPKEPPPKAVVISTPPAPTPAPARAPTPVISDTAPVLHNSILNGASPEEMHLWRILGLAADPDGRLSLAQLHLGDHQEETLERLKTLGLVSHVGSQRRREQGDVGVWLLDRPLYDRLLLILLQRGTVLLLPPDTLPPEERLRWIEEEEKVLALCEALIHAEVTVLQDKVKALTGLQRQIGPAEKQLARAATQIEGERKAFDERVDQALSVLGGGDPRAIDRLLSRLAEAGGERVATQVHELRTALTKTPVKIDVPPPKDPPPATRRVPPRRATSKEILAAVSKSFDREIKLLKSTLSAGPRSVRIARNVCVYLLAKRGFDRDKIGQVLERKIHSGVMTGMITFKMELERDPELLQQVNDLEAELGLELTRM